jgi:hypothetical protein
VSTAGAPSRSPAPAPQSRETAAITPALRPGSGTPARRKPLLPGPVGNQRPRVRVVAVRHLSLRSTTHPLLSRSGAAQEGLAGSQRRIVSRRTGSPRLGLLPFRSSRSAEVEPSSSRGGSPLDAAEGQRFAMSCHEGADPGLPTRERTDSSRNSWRDRENRKIVRASVRLLCSAALRPDHRQTTQRR